MQAHAAGDDGEGAVGKGERARIQRFALSGDEQLGIDRFYRFNASLQAFIEEARSVPTRLA